jgi:DNA-binding NtrC family response regulator
MIFPQLGKIKSFHLSLTINQYTELNMNNKEYLIFVVDDDSWAREVSIDAIHQAVQARGVKCEGFVSAEDALKAMEKYRPHLILLDIGLPGMDGIKALEQIKQKFPEVLVIMITAYDDIKTVVTSIKLGAHDYVTKPLQINALKVSIRNTLETLSLRSEIRELQEGYLKENIPCFIGESDAIQGVMEVVEKVAQSPDTTILILGETGTGKELIAKAVHYNSPNFKGQMINVNCAAIPRELIESELFGYEKGAFTGAEASGKVGLVEKAANGTLFLDEVGDLSMEAQVKLMRFLEDGVYYRVGGTKERRVKTRIVSATNRNLDEMVEEKRFRADLYYRLAVVKIEIPSLNERREDIVSIAMHFLDEFNKKFSRGFTGISREAVLALKNHQWRGNVRELKNMVEKAVLLGNEPELTVESLFGEESKSLPAISEKNGEEGMGIPELTKRGIDLPLLVESIEKHYFENALDISGGNESKAAQLLNLSRDVFRYRKKKIGIS